MSHDRDCHIHGCMLKPTKGGGNLCRRHWFALPEDVRERIRWAVQEAEDDDSGMELASALEAAVDALG